MGRYDVQDLQGHYAPGSGDRVLANKLAIVTPEEMDAVELILLEKLYLSVFENHFPDHAITVAMIKAWHRRWLGNVYDWAGRERTVNISKDGFPFAPAAQLTRLLSQFESRCLFRYTPCSGMRQEQLIEAIAIVHVEYILIHPFREGNGRLSRLLADVMSAQAGFDTLDYQSWEENKPRYIAAIHAGMGGNYEPMKYWVNRALPVT